MKISYDYSVLLTELKGDLKEGLIEENDMIKIVRGDYVHEDYRPIIDYYYDDDLAQEIYYKEIVSDVIKEMEEYNRIV